MVSWSTVWYSTTIVLPLSTWSYFIWFILKKRKQWKYGQLFDKRHNCIVMYSRTRGITGWPVEEKPKKGTINFGSSLNVNIQFEPICYFISTAKKSLDIAVMILSIHSIGEALICAKNQGVQVRIIVDFLAAKGNSLIKKLENSGIEINYYVPPVQGRESIMHYKYMVKDYVEGSGGFASAGSMNWTITGLFNNYENIVFSSDNDFAAALHENFIQTWNFIESTKTSYYVKAKYALSE